MARFIELNEYDKSVINIDAIEQVENINNVNPELRIWFTSGACRDFHYESCDIRDNDFERITGGLRHG